MAMQAGMGLSKVFLLVGTGFAGSIMLRNVKLSDILSELQTLLKEKSADNSGDESEYGEVLAMQVKRLALEVRQLASARPITVLNGSSGNMASLAVPAATMGALGYGYMWWKGISFSDLMYVTKRNMANAVSSMTKHLEQVSAALAATKKHLTQRIQHLDDKLDEQKEMSVEIKNEVTDARNKLENIGFELNSLQQLVWGLNGKVDAMEDKQDFTCAGVAYICNFIGERGAKLPDYLQDLPKPSGKRLYINHGDGILKGLQHIAESGNLDESKIDAGLQNDLDLKGVSRTASIKW
ncbi:uncharacterized protein LOC120254524 [Dioscorea cayenensis subsp. rotundata]|uniref:Uncharacterized protein LOC120254524 n=1 Tax=Dioscorea cayennensis subsp. rotundata TaxID=55577 RepID=A0AB40AUT1_DIOCR|nr:uncharacterized protein LOC120254524 [Dioscorea cayenensis subsp. rotundata]